MDELVKQCVIGILEDAKAYEDARQQGIQALEAKGHRIIGGGQTSPYGDDGKCDWEITDWRTGDVIASGRGSYEDMDEGMAAALDAADPGDTFTHVDHVSGDLYDKWPGMQAPDSATPTSLVAALTEWVENLSTTDEDIAWLVGWSADKVAEYRST